MATKIPGGPPQPHFPWPIAIAAFLLGLIAGYALNEMVHSRDQQTLSIRVPDQFRK
ncbi:MAG: hypothetical protein JWQ90_3468 [Hydrocarboniphaga sp.]|nr:hypothetical protein [Hydrocarboniphaga sp.]